MCSRWIQLGNNRELRLYRLYLLITRVSSNPAITDRLRAVADYGNSQDACGRVLDATVSVIWFGPAVASGTQPQAPARSSQFCVEFLYVPDSQSNLTTPAATDRLQEYAGLLPETPPPHGAETPCRAFAKCRKGDDSADFA